MSSRRKDYYKILGITKEAEPEHIKRAYKKLAIKWHPDKNPGREKEAEEKFKDIAEAYAVLSNERKRRQYDKYGTVDFDNDRETTTRDYSAYDGLGFGGEGFQGFTFERAENLFRDVFGEEYEQYGFGRNHPYSNTSEPPRYNAQQDFANDFMGGRGFGNFFTDFGFGGFGGRGQDPFANDFFRNFGGIGGMGGMGGLPNMGFSFGPMGSFGGVSGGTSQSVSTSTIIRNGKEVTVTKTTLTNPDGTTHTEVQEHVKDGGRTLASNRYVNQGQNPRLENSNKQIEYKGNNQEINAQNDGQNQG